MVRIYMRYDAKSVVAGGIQGFVWMSITRHGSDAIDVTFFGTWRPLPRGNCRLSRKGRKVWKSIAIEGAWRMFVWQLPLSKSSKELDLKASEFLG